MEAGRGWRYAADGVLSLGGVVDPLITVFGKEDFLKRFHAMMGRNKQCESTPMSSTFSKSIDHRDSVDNYASE